MRIAKPLSPFRGAILRSKKRTSNFEWRSAGHGCFLLLIAAAPVFMNYSFYNVGKPRNLTNTQVEQGRGVTIRYSHLVRRSRGKSSRTAPSNLTVTRAPVPIVQAARSYLNRTFLTTHTTVPFDSSGGDFIVLCASSHAGVTMAPADSFNNTWISAAGPTNTKTMTARLHLRTQIWYAKNPNVGPHHTVTLNLSMPQPLVLSVIVVRGSNMSAPIDAISTIGDNGGSQTFQIISPHIATTNNNDLLIGFAKSSASEIFAPTSGFTTEPAASSDFLDAETRPAATPGTYDATFSLNNVATWQAVIVAVSPSPYAFALSWTGSADYMGSTEYVVERCQGVNCRDFAPIDITTLTTFSDTKLLSTTNCRYRVRAIDADGNLSHYSNVAETNFSPNLPQRARISLHSYRAHAGWKQQDATPTRRSS